MLWPFPYHGIPTRLTPSTPRRQDFAGHALWVCDVATAAGATDPTGALPGDMALAAERPRPSECFITKGPTRRLESGQVDIYIYVRYNLQVLKKWVLQMSNCLCFPCAERWSRWTGFIDDHSVFVDDPQCLPVKYTISWLVSPTLVVQPPRLTNCVG